MEVVMTILYALVIVVALLLTILILIQPSKSGGFGAVFGARAGSHLTKATVVMTVIFFVLALALAAIIGHNRSSKSLTEKYSEDTVQTQPEQPKTDAAPAMGAPAADKAPAAEPEKK